MPAPATLKAQKRVVGMFAYYSKFVKNFSEKICVLNQNFDFLLSKQVVKVFATLVAIDPNGTFEVETDASDFCLAATFNQQGRPVAFFSRTLSKSE